MLEVPGAKRDTIQVHLNEDQSALPVFFHRSARGQLTSLPHRRNLLTICGFIEKPSPLNKEGNFVHREGMYGYFSREVQVPRDLKEGQVKARYENGILLVEIPDAKGTSLELTLIVPIPHAADDELFPPFQARRGSRSRWSKPPPVSRGRAHYGGQWLASSSVDME